jgi:Flp pilus assembly protein TadD
MQGEIEVAIGHFRQAVAVKPLLPRAWFTLGAALMRIEQWDAALQAYTRVVQQCPDDGEAWGNCGAIHLRAGNWEQAQAALAQALKQNRASWRMWDNQVRLRHHLCSSCAVHCQR